MQLYGTVSKTVELVAMYRAVLMVVVLTRCSCEKSAEGEELSAESPEMNNLVINDASKQILTEFPDSLPENPKCVRWNEGKMTTPAAEQSNSSSSESSEDGASLANYPYVVSIQRRDAHYATGALLHPRWVLTVAAQFYYVRESIKLFRAHLGSVDCKRGVVIPLARVEVHPSFEGERPALDLALLRLASSAVLSAFVQPIALSAITDKVISAKFLSAYWPRLIIKGQVLPASAQERVRHTSLRVSTQMLVPWDKCAVKLHELGVKLPVTSLCLRPITKYHSACMPDAGAPVVGEDGLWGITSGWVPARCPRPAAPAVFTRLALPAAHLWLQHHLN